MTDIITKYNNLIESFLLAVLISAGDYIFGASGLSWRGLGLAIFAAIGNWYFTHKAGIKNDAGTN